MEIRETIPPYNAKRYDPPWAANVALNGNKTLDYVFNGLYLGTAKGGELVIDTAPGEVIAIGQKDNRRPGKSTNDLFVVTNNGELDYRTRDQIIYYLRSK